MPSGHKDLPQICCCHKDLAQRSSPQNCSNRILSSFAHHNAKIHMYPELEAAIHQTGARLLFLPPYCPQLNPIEVCFGQLKRWIQRHANLVFPLFPEVVLQVAMPNCTKRANGTLGLYSHCGYDIDGLRLEVFASVCDDNE